MLDLMEIESKIDELRETLYRLRTVLIVDVPNLMAHTRKLETQVSDLTGELAATEAGRAYFNRAWADAVAVLRMVEWADGEEYCPWCGGGKPWDEGRAGGHNPNCPRQAVLGVPNP